MNATLTGTVNGSATRRSNDLTDRVDLPRLRTAIDNDYRICEVYRRNIVELTKEFVGNNYSENGSEQENPVNIISLYTRILVDYLVPSDPRIMCSTFNTKYRPYANILEEWGNRKLLKMKFGDILRSSVYGGIFLMGWVKTAITAPASARFSGYGVKAGEILMMVVDFEDMVFDTRAKRFSECDYIGHYYDAFLDDVQAMPGYDKKARAEVAERADTMLTQTGEERQSAIARGTSVSQDEYHPKARLCEVWLRKENLIVTFDAYGEGERPLKVQKWIGPACGPYKQLSFIEVLGNLMPKGPAQDALDEHKSINLLTRKLDNQASRMKKGHAYRDLEDMKRLSDMQDGGSFQCSDPKTITEITSGGPDPNTANWLAQKYNQTMKMLGNLNSLGGLESQAQTATQEKLVHESASNLIQAMGKRVMAFAQDLVGMEGLGWYWWNSPHEDFTSTYSVQGLADISIDRKVTPLDRFGVPADDIDLMVDPYSLSRQTPVMRLGGLEKMVKEIFLPSLPMFGQPGVSDLLAEYVKLAAKYSNNPDLIVLLEKLVGVSGPPDGTQTQQKGPQPAPETTEHIRTSRPGMTGEGQSQVLQQMMASGQQGPASGQMLGQMGGQQ